MSETDVPKTLPTVKVSFTDEFANEIMDEQAHRLEKLAKQDYYNITVGEKSKTFKRRKIRSAERAKIQALRNKLATSRLKEHSAAEEELYIAMSGYYLIDNETGNPMTKEQYMDTTFEEIRDVLEACSFRTEKPIPPPLETKT